MLAVSAGQGQPVEPPTLVSLLALDTSTPQAVVVIRRADGAVFSALSDPTQRHGRGLLPAVRDLLHQAGLGMADLGGFAVGLGPGSFTGLRIGVMAAKTLAFATNRPLIGLDSLDLFARAAPAGAAQVSVAVDAQRGDLFTADYGWSDALARWARERPPGIEPAPRWLGRLRPGTWALGPAIGRMPGPLPNHLRCLDPVELYPRAEALAALAAESWREERRDDAWFLEPVYLRRSAAEEKRGLTPDSGPGFRV